VVDEVGYIPFDPQAANLIFMLVSRRYERASLIVTSNKPFSAWGEIFGDDVVAAAMIDRLVHHAEILALKAAPTASKIATSRARRPPGPPKPPDRSPSASARKPAERLYAARVERERASRTRKRNSRAQRAQAGRLRRPGIPLSNERESGPVFNRREWSNIRPALTASLHGRRPRRRSSSLRSCAGARTEVRPVRGSGRVSRSG
jgi:hypothetical protein